MGGTLQNQLSFKITVLGAHSLLWLRNAQDRKDVRKWLLSSANATLRDFFSTFSDRSPWPEYLLRLIGMELELPRFSQRSVNTSLQSKKQALPSLCFFPSNKTETEIFIYFTGIKKKWKMLWKWVIIINAYRCCRSMYVSEFKPVKSQGLISFHILFLLMMVWKGCAPSTYLVPVSQVSVVNVISLEYEG